MLAPCLDCYSPSFQPGNINSPFTHHLKGHFGEVFYGRESHRSPLSAPLFSLGIGPLFLTRDMVLQSKDYIVQPPLRLDEVI